MQLHHIKKRKGYCKWTMGCWRSLADKEYPSLAVNLVDYNSFNKTFKISNSLQQPLKSEVRWKHLSIF